METSRKRKALVDDILVKDGQTTTKRSKIKNPDTGDQPKINKVKKVKVVNDIPDPCGSDNDSATVAWDEIEVLANTEKVSRNIVRNFVKLLNDGCTLPFIARYRKSSVDFMMPERLQDLYESYQNICNLKKKVKSVLVTLKKANKLNPELEKSILKANTLAELDFIYSPLKSHTQTLAEKARNLGLEDHAIRALNGHYIDITTLCSNEEELATPDKVEAHITHIIADMIYRDSRVIEQMRLIKTETRFTLKSSRTKSSQKPKEKIDNKKVDSKSDPETYKLYFEWKCPTHLVRPHQVLALNRGEDEKILSVKVDIPDWYYHQLQKFVSTLWKSSHWVAIGLTDAYTRLIKPWLSRQVRSELTSIAHKEAIKTFTANLEKYLLTEPIKNVRIAGLDPGFKAGCKIGVIDKDGQMLEACTLYPDFRKKENDPAIAQLKAILEKHNVDVVGLGNGTASRPTESWCRRALGARTLVIVPEQGASVYSVSKEAQKEHPNMDPNLISALSIARRVLDPMGELIKVEPKSLGVGLYQHDIPARSLDAALDVALEKVVSLAGADLQTASLSLLRRISGLNENRAKKIIEYRTKNGGISSREELLKVSGIGKVTYQQCAGFLRVSGDEPLDGTMVHPERYDVARRLATHLNLDLTDLKKSDFPQKVERKLSRLHLNELCQELNVELCDLELIINAFKQKNYEDNMITYCKPVFPVSVQNTEDLVEGMEITGVVRNVVPFGCFVDCGVGDNGLIHRSNLGANKTPKLGDRVLVTVIAPPRPRKLQLRLDRILD